jgi:hypothetical protein
MAMHLMSANLCPALLELAYAVGCSKPDFRRQQCGAKKRDPLAKGDVFSLSVTNQDVR